MSALRRWSWLAAILLVAAAFRFYALGQAGILGVDEGRYVLDGVSKYVEGKLCFDVARAKVEERRGENEFLLNPFLTATYGTMAYYHPFSPKLGYNYLSALLMAFHGYSVMTPTFVEAACGILMIWMLYVLLCAVRNARAGLIGAAMLALSCYHVYFSRNAYPQCCSGLLLIVAVWSHFKWAASRQQGQVVWAPVMWLVACGALMGLSFWTNYQAAGALPFLPFLHAAVCAREGSRRVTIQQFLLGGVALAAGFFAILAFAEAVSYPFILLYRSQGMAYPHSTFFELLWPRFAAQTSKPFNISGLLLFPFFVWRLDGWGGVLLSAALIVIGVAILWARYVHESRYLRSDAFVRPFAYLVVPFLVPLLVFSLKTLQGARMFTYALPFFIGILAVIVDAAWHSTRQRRLLRLVVATVLVLAGVSTLVHDAEVLRIRSAYPQLVAHLGVKGQDETYAPWSAVFESYRLASKWQGGELPLDPMPGSANAVYFVNDWQEVYGFGYPDESKVLPQDATVIETFKHDFGRIFLEIEAFPSEGPTLANIRWVRNLDLERSRKLLVYKIGSGK